MVDTNHIRRIRGAIRKGAHESAADEILRLLDSSASNDTIQAIYQALWDVFSKEYENPAFSNAEKLRSKDWSNLLCMDAVLMAALSQRTDEPSTDALLMWADLCGRLASGIHQAEVVSLLRTRQRKIYEELLGDDHNKVLSVLLEEAARAARVNDSDTVQKVLAVFEERTSKTSITSVEINAHAWRELAEYHFANQDYNRAQQMWMQIAEHFSNNYSPTYWGITDCYFGAADCCFKSGNHLEAEALYRRAIGHENRRMAQEIGGDFTNSMYYTELRNAYIKLLLQMNRHDDVAKFAEKYPERETETENLQQDLDRS